MAVAVQVVGARELQAALRSVSAELPRRMAAANKAAALIVVERALPNVPVKSGRLRASIRALGSQRSARVRAGSASVPYAAAIHWGRKRGNVGSPPGNHSGNNPVRGRPFLWEAAQSATPAVVTEYKAQIDALMEQIGD